MHIALLNDRPSRRPRPHEIRYFWYQDDPVIARQEMDDAELFYAAARFLCTSAPFEQVKSLASAAMIAFGAETILGKQALLRAAFDDPAHVNVSQLMYSQFRQYCDGRRIDPMALRFPRLPAPRPGTPRHHWAHTVEPAVRRLPPRSRKDLRTCVFAYFFGFAWFDELPTAPEWIVQVLMPPEEAGSAAPPGLAQIPRPGRRDEP